MYKDSIADCVAANYPEYTWKAWRFGQLPYHGYWDKKENQRAAFDDIAKGNELQNIFFLKKIRTWCYHME